jgi:hypothetical protein
MFSDQDVDRELKAALSVSPSPDFEARVLRRVEADRPSRWPAHYGWLATAASLVIAAGVFYALNRTSVVVTPVAAPKIVEHTAPARVTPQPEVPARKSPGAPARVETVRLARHASQAPRSFAPEVLVPVNQMEAVRRLVRAVNEGRIEMPAEPPQGPMAPPPAVTVMPVAVEPIPLAPLGPAGETATPPIRRLK